MNSHSVLRACACRRDSSRSTHSQPPIAGRWFTEDEERDTGPNAVVISERFWTRRFNREPSAIGRTLAMGGKGYPIVGVMPASFTAATTDVWLPSKINAWLLGQREARFLNGVGRLRRGVTIEQAARDLALVQEELAKQFPKTDTGWAVEVRSLKEVRIGTSRRGLILVFASVGALWLIAVANIAGLTLVQVRRRARDLAIRAALGASRAYAIAMIWREGLIIGALGASLGAALAIGLVRLMPAILTATPRIDELALDWRARVHCGDDAPRDGRDRRRPRSRRYAARSAADDRGGVAGCGWRPLAIFGLRPLGEVVDGAFDQARLDAAMLSSFASAALALAGVGLYSLFMLVVSDRTREIAVRLAIGASPGEMIRLIAAAAGRLLAGGIVLGIILTAAADRVLRGLLFGVTSFDAAALAASAAVIAAVAMTAVAVPAIRAERVTPTDALRGD